MYFEKTDRSHRFLFPPKKSSLLIKRPSFSPSLQDSLIGINILIFLFLNLRQDDGKLLPAALTVDCGAHYILPDKQSSPHKWVKVSLADKSLSSAEMTAQIHLYQLSLRGTAANHPGEDASDRSDLGISEAGFTRKLSKMLKGKINQTANGANSKLLLLYFKGLSVPLKRSIHNIFTWREVTFLLTLLLNEIRAAIEVCLW